jgi:hypothetical protein
MIRYDYEMEQESSLADPVVALVKRLLPSALLEPDAKQEPGIHGQSDHIHLPAPVGADYRFTLWLGDGEKQISARLASNEAAYFWYRPFEEAEFRSADELGKAFLEAVEQIVRHNTRIEQKRGWLFNHFKCEYESATRGWKRVYAHSGLRWIRAPKIAGRSHTYHSPPLIREI